MLGLDASNAQRATNGYVSKSGDNKSRRLPVKVLMVPLKVGTLRKYTPKAKFYCTVPNE